MHRDILIYSFYYITLNATCRIIFYVPLQYHYIVLITTYNIYLLLSRDVPILIFIADVRPFQES